MVANMVEKRLIKADMPTVAQQLHLAREGQNLTVNQVAEVTKIRSDHIRALEEGNFNVFSAPVYIRGFVRTYANLLKLDVSELMAALESELKKTDKFHEPPPLTDQEKGALDFVTLQLSKVNWRVAVVLVAIVVVLGMVYSGILARRNQKSSDPLSNLTPGVYKPAASGSGETLPVPSTPPRKP
jgi:cytoskeleton protein RodZ